MPVRTAVKGSQPEEEARVLVLFRREASIPTTKRAVLA